MDGITDTVLSPNHGGKRSSTTAVIIHKTESGIDTALAVARYFANPNTDASAHIIVDRSTTVRSVPNDLIAYGARGANGFGLHIEICGYSKDATPDESLYRAAQIVAQWCDEYRIPIRKGTTADLKAGKRGIYAHKNVSEAFHMSTHTDPGPLFPWTRFIEMVEDYMSPEDMQKLADLTAKSVWDHKEKSPVSGKMVRMGTYLTSIHKNVFAVLKRTPKP